MVYNIIKDNYIERKDDFYGKISRLNGTKVWKVDRC